MLALRPRRGIIDVYAIVWVVVYLLLMFALKDFLPEKYMRDSMTIQMLADNAQAKQDATTAYSIAGTVAAVFPLWFLNILVAAVGSVTIWTVVTSLRSLRGMLLAVPVLGPAIILNLVQFGKETFTIPFAFLVLWIAKKSSSKTKAFLAIAAAYAFYGAFFREYYAIILMAFAGILLLRRSPAPLRIVYVLLAIAALCVVPAHVLDQLQGSRDVVNRIYNAVSNAVRTSIYNPFPPDNAWHFALNYIYVLARLNLPLLFDHTPNEFVLTLNLVIYGALVFMGIRRSSGTAMDFLPWLFLSHLLVLAIFEPDSGSYFRHFSSVLVYLIPTLRLVEQRYAARTLRETTG